MCSADKDAAAQALQGCVTHMEYMEVLAHLAVKAGTATAEETFLVSNRRRHQLKAAEEAWTGCGQCNVCVGSTKRISKASKPARPGNHVLVSPHLCQLQYKSGIVQKRCQRSEAVSNRDGCLLLQALRGYANAKAGLVYRLGELTHVWHGEKRGSAEGEWFLGEVVAFDPRSMACYMQFSRVKDNGELSRDDMSKYDCWLQPARDSEFLKPYRNQNSCS